jgi:hypothetical protein
MYGSPNPRRLPAVVNPLVTSLVAIPAVRCVHSAVRVIGMEQALIRFDGEAFHWTDWSRMLRQLGFRVVGGVQEKAKYVSGGSHVVAESHGFVRRDDQQGYEYQLTLKQTRRWEGTIKFYSVLLAAFAMPQRTVVTLAGHTFTERDALRMHAETALIREYTLEELIAHGAYRPHDGVQFV